MEEGKYGKNIDAKIEKGMREIVNKPSFNNRNVLELLLDADMSLIQSSEREGSSGDEGKRRAMEKMISASSVLLRKIHFLAVAQDYNLDLLCEELGPTDKPFYYLEQLYANFNRLSENF